MRFWPYLCITAGIILLVSAVIAAGYIAAVELHR